MAPEPRGGIMGTLSCFSWGSVDYTDRLTCRVVQGYLSIVPVVSVVPFFLEEEHQGGVSLRVHCQTPDVLAVHVIPQRAQHQHHRLIFYSTLDIIGISAHELRDGAERHLPKAHTHWFCCGSQREAAETERLLPVSWTHGSYNVVPQKVHSRARVQRFTRWKQNGYRSKVDVEVYQTGQRRCGQSSAQSKQEKMILSSSSSLQHHQRRVSRNRIPSQMNSLSSPHLNTDALLVYLIIYQVQMLQTK